MPPKVPSFGSQDYWNTRFTANADPFEWLEGPTVLDPYLLESLSTSGDRTPQLLHIGCGTSLLSYHLRAHVTDPGQVHNLDYSDVVIDISKKREVELYDEHSASEPGKGPEVARETSYMRWSAADLLDHSSLLEACRPASYSLIVDKSTADSIACSDDLYVPLPYPVSMTAHNNASWRLTESSEPVHPLHIMAVHLALVAKPKARWICLSYSMDRFPFLPSTTTQPTIPSEEEGPEDLGPQDDLDDLPMDMIENGFPDPSRLWKLAGKYPIEAPLPAATPNGHSGAVTTHRPKVVHYIYVLERTDIEVRARG